MVDSTVPAGAYSIWVSDSGGPSNSVTLNLKPRLDQISPARGVQGRVINGVVLTGQGFGDGSTLVVNAPDMVFNRQSVSDTQITGQIQINDDAVGIAGI